MDLKGSFALNEPLRKHTTFKIGGSCRYFFEPKDEADLKHLLKLLKRYNISYLVIGLGSNILVNDKGIKQAVIRLSAPSFKKVSFKNQFASVGSGCILNKVILAAKDKDLGGLEFFSGVPGTVGGAVVMNAGSANEKEGIGKFVKSVKVIDKKGDIRQLTRKNLNFSYRKSNLSQYIVLSVILKFEKKEKNEVLQEIKKQLKKRSLSQDWQYPSAGCVFKNPAGCSAGKLIDLCGYKGYEIGGAAVSSKHANFIINKNKAKAEDVLKLISVIKHSVKDKFNIELKPEIKIWN